MSHEKIAIPFDINSLKLSYIRDVEWYQIIAKEYQVVDHSDADEISVS